MTRHSKASALSPREFELLLEGARRIEKDRQRTETVFAVLVMGRLGLRSGELVHLREDWVNWRQRRIEIPRQQDCTLGADGGPCGYCHQLAEQMVEVYEDGDAQEMSRERERFINRHLEGSWKRGDSLRKEDVLNLRWFGKTESAARDVPFSHDPRSGLAIERFFELAGKDGGRRDGWALSKSAVNRRLNKALRLADELTVDSTMPHGLRATAATEFANRNIDPLSLKSVMGWSDFQTAQNYLSESAERTERALQQIR